MNRNRSTNRDSTNRDSTNRCSTRRRSGRRRATFGAVAVAMTLTAAACVADDAEPVADSAADPRAAAGDCTVIDVAVSSEKIELISDLADEFNRDAPTIDGECFFVVPSKKASGGAATALVDGWDEGRDGPEPEIWSPASAAWGAIVTERRGDEGAEQLVPSDPVSFMKTPLVIAMPEPMATALGYPAKPIGYADILRLARDPQGWAAAGHPEWGPFRLGKTNPNFSTSGLSALIAQNYAAVGATSGLSAEQLNAASTVEFNKGIESAVVHYGDITMTFLENWFRADRAGRAMTYASAVAVEEKSVIDYNAGNPDGVLDRGEEPEPPRTKLVAVYPSEGTLFSDNPMYVLNAEWSTDGQRKASQEFVDFLAEADNQRRVLDYGFRPGSVDVELADPITEKNGVDPSQPATLLRVPEPSVTVQLLDSWAQQRKAARVMLVLDVSGSMQEPVSADDSTPKLIAARDAIVNAADQFRADDEVGIRIFSTELGPNEDLEFIDVLPVEEFGARGEGLANTLAGLTPMNGTPLYSATTDAVRDMANSYNPDRINAVVVLSDGRNSDGDDGDDSRQLDSLVTTLRDAALGEGGTPIPVFTIAYGADADPSVLEAIANASSGAAYSATNAASIDTVLTSVISNF